MGHQNLFLFFLVENCHWGRKVDLNLIERNYLLGVGGPYVVPTGTKVSAKEYLITVITYGQQRKQLTTSFSYIVFFTIISTYKIWKQSDKVF